MIQRVDWSRKSIDEKLEELHRFAQTQSEINLRNAEVRKDQGEKLKRHDRELELLFLAGCAPTRRERRDARETLVLLRSELDAPPPEMATYAEEDRRKVEFSALVVICAVASGVLIVGGLFAWWVLS